MSLITQRLKRYLENKNISINKAELYIGISRGTLSKALRNKKSISTDTLEKFLRQFKDINPVWLLTGKGKMILLDKEVSKPSQDIMLEKIIMNFFSFPIEKQSEIKNVLSKHLVTIINELNLLDLVSQHDIDKDVENYTKQLKDAQVLLQKDREIEALQNKIKELETNN